MHSLYTTVVLGLITVAAWVPGCGKVPAAQGKVKLGGQYGDVESKQLLGENTCNGTGGQSGASLKWKFDKSRFEMTENGQSFPTEVTNLLLGEGKTAKTITGEWTLDSNKLRLSNVKADGKGGYPDTILNVFRTPVVRLYFGKTQYYLSNSKPFGRGPLPTSCFPLNEADEVGK